MNINAVLRCKESEIKPRAYEVSDVITLSDAEYRCAERAVERQRISERANGARRLRVASFENGQRRNTRGYARVCLSEILGVYTERAADSRKFCAE